MNGSDNPATGKAPSAALAVLLIAAVWAAVYLPALSALPLADPEESRCAVTADHMLRHGEWLVPHVDGRPYFEKPPLFFWLAAGATALTGDLELGGRLVSALSALGVALCAWALGRRMFSPRTGLLAGLAAVVSLEDYALGRWYRMEMLFTLLLALAILCFWIAGEDRPRAAGRRSRAWYGFYVFAGLAVLTKGPIGLLLPVLVGSAYLLASGQWRRMRDFLHAPGLGLFLLIAAPWFVYMVSRFGGPYVDEFFVSTHFQRAADGFKGNVYPPGFYLIVLALGFLPWTIVLPAAAWRSFPWPRLAESDGPRRAAVVRVWRADARHLFLWTWAVVIVAFFECSRTKFVHYILSAFLPLAIVVGEYLANAIAAGKASAGDRGLRRTQVAAMIGSAVVAAGVAAFEAVALGSYVGFLILLPAAATILLVWRAMKTARPALFAAALVAGMTAMAVYVDVHAMPRMYERISARAEGLAAAKLIARTDRVFFIGENDRSLLLYSGFPDALCYNPNQARELRKPLQSAPATLLFERMHRFKEFTDLIGGVDFSDVNPLGRDVAVVHTKPYPVDTKNKATTATATSATRAGG